MSPNVPAEKKKLLALALASGVGVNAAAEQFEMSRKTVQRWLKRPGFRRVVAELRGQLVETALGRMADHMTRSADALGALLDADDLGVRLRAARAVLGLGLRMRDSVEIAERVRELEEELARKQGVAPWE